MEDDGGWFQLDATNWRPYAEDVRLVQIQEIVATNRTVKDHVYFILS